MDRYFYTAAAAHNLGDETLVPNNTEKLAWLPLPEAMEIITFPHIKVMMKQVMDHSNQLWGGTVLRYQKDKNFKATIIRPFFELD